MTGKLMQLYTGKIFKKLAFTVLRKFINWLKSLAKQMLRSTSYLPRNFKLSTD